MKYENYVFIGDFNLNTSDNSMKEFCSLNGLKNLINRSSPPWVFLGKGVLKIYSKFTAEHPCRSVITIKLQSNFIEITLRHGCSRVNLLHIFRTLFLKNISGRPTCYKNSEKTNLHFFNIELFLRLDSLSFIYSQLLNLK